MTKLNLEILAIIYENDQ